jgi:hypothetical protein
MSERSASMFCKLPLAWQEDTPWEHTGRVEYFEALGYFVFSVQTAVRIIVPRLELTRELLQTHRKSGEYFWLDCVVEVDLDNLVAAYGAQFILEDFQIFHRDLQRILDKGQGQASFAPLEHWLEFTVDYKLGKAVIKARHQGFPYFAYDLTFELEGNEYELREMLKGLHQILQHYSAVLPRR